MRCIRAALAALVLAIAGGAALAQSEPVLGIPSSPILRLDQERLFRQSVYGQRVVQELEAATRDLTAENTRIDEALAEEELALTEQRAKMEPAAFREAAAAFDEKVVAIRKSQDAKSRALSETLDRERVAFYEQAYPLLFEIVAAAGAVAILDSRAIILSSNAIDVTDVAIARVNDAIGDGSKATTDTPEPASND
ncbi:MAG: OmpH family outer membrane protein [Brevirhabdus sp.]